MNFKKKRFKNGEMTLEYREWRQKVLTRDNNICQMPGCVCNTRARLQVHHIVKWSKNKSLRYSVDNGITLCRRSHKAIFGKEEIFEQLFNLLVILNKSSKTNTKSRT